MTDVRAGGHIERDAEKEPRLSELRSRRDDAANGYSPNRKRPRRRSRRTGADFMAKKSFRLLEEAWPTMETEKLERTLRSLSAFVSKNEKELSKREAENYAKATATLEAMVAERRAAESERAKEVARHGASILAALGR